MFAALLQGPLIRLIPVGVLLVALQRTVVVELQIGGVTIQLLMAFAAAAGAVGGSERGAIAGFVVGIMFDLVEGTPLGSTAIAMTLAGVVAGLLPLIAADPQWWLLAIFTGLGASAGEAALPVVRLFAGESDPFPPEMAKIVAIVGVSSMVLSPLLCPLARWCFRIKAAEWKAPPDSAAA